MIDETAGWKLAALREALGMSPEALAADIKMRAKSEPWGARGTVDAWTIREIEDRGHIPGPRIRFVLASYFGEPIWYLPPGPLIKASARDRQPA